MSPRRKRPKLTPKKKPKPSPKKNNNLKRESDPEDLSRKRLKGVINEEENDVKARRKNNFTKACRQVSFNAYYDHGSRFLLLYYLPSCMKTSACKHHDKSGTDIKQMPMYAEESFAIEIKNYMWYEALEVAQICITPKQYLSANLLKEIVEIILNIHEDELSEYRVSDIIDKCQQILSFNFSSHPPCQVKSLKNCYKSFLTSPMDLKEKTFTNRTEFECRKGIVKYCMNRLEYEISTESPDGPIINKDVPDDMKHSLQGVHWQKEKFDIFELLDRPQRIERLMAVLETVIELLQFDLAIWHLRHNNNLVHHIMRLNKPLMAFVLWSDNVLYTGAVNNNCRQILRLFAYLTHLRYPDSMLRIITTWLNTMIQTLYICEQNSKYDYPNTAKYCTSFANEFYKIIKDLPYESINRILERIEPKFMRHLVGVIHIKTIHKTNSDCVISILINFIRKSEWQSYSPDNTEIKITKLFFEPKKIKKILNYVVKQCKNCSPENEENIQYDRLDKRALEVMLETEPEMRLKHLVHAMYITLEAHLDMYNVHCMQETWNKLNEEIIDDNQTNNQELVEHSSYEVTETFIKKYKNIITKIQELKTAFHNLKNAGDMPDILEIFTHIINHHTTVKTE